jgi:uncharacterized membrane protein YfcA
MTVELALLVVVVGAVSGTLIGTVGIGGVLLVPALVLFGGLGVEEATPVASMSFFFTGVAGTLAYSRTDRVPWESVRWLMVGVVPGALAGAAGNVALSSDVLTGVIAVVLGAAAVRAIIPERADRPLAGKDLPPRAMLAIGVLVGFGSALTGTGGPVLLIPVMLLLGGGVVVTIAASQPIQVPIAIFATAAFLAYGELDWELGLVLGLAQVAGVIVGARLGDRLPAEALRNLVGIALGVSALVFFIKAVTG